MNQLQMIEAARKDAFEKEGLYGHCIFQNIRADFVPTSSRSTLAKFTGRISWKIDGKRATKEQVKALIG
jgi:hypothetical protein